MLRILTWSVELNQHILCLVQDYWIKIWSIQIHNICLGHLRAALLARAPEMEIIPRKIKQLLISNDEGGDSFSKHTGFPNSASLSMEDTDVINETTTASWEWIN